MEPGVSDDGSYYDHRTMENESVEGTMQEHEERGEDGIEEDIPEFEQMVEGLDENDNKSQMGKKQRRRPDNR